jgi:bacteriocin-like protein
MELLKKLQTDFKVLNRNELKQINGGLVDLTRCQKTLYNCANGTSETPQVGLLCKGFENGQVTETLYNILGQVACQ